MEAKKANSPAEPGISVSTLPPVSETLAPVLLRTAGESSPSVMIIAGTGGPGGLGVLTSVRVIVDPVPEA
jgi:hypothetical protein